MVRFIVSRLLLIIVPHPGYQVLQSPLHEEEKGSIGELLADWIGAFVLLMAPL
jgi:hypothetical protein